MNFNPCVQFEKTEKMKVDIFNKELVNSNQQNQIIELFKQISPNKKQIELNKILEKENQITVAYCELNNKIVGIASMCNYKVISGNKGWIEDVVVDSEMRGQGIGKKLMEKLLEVARLKELTEILLYTEDHRIPAIKLYNNLGFKQKDSRIYYLKTI